MKIKSKLIAASVFLLEATSARAYVPPARFILHMLARKRMDVSAVTVRSHVSAMDGTKVSATHFSEVTHFEASTGLLRSWALDDTGNVLFSSTRKVAEAPAGASVLLEGSSTQMISALLRAGVVFPKVEEPSAAPIAHEAHDTASGTHDAPTLVPVQPDPSDGTLLKRWNRHVAWVVGGAGNSAFWVEKDTFLPLRLIGLNVGATASFDIQWDDYRFFRDFAYPRSALVLSSSDPKNEVPVLRADLEDVSLGESGVSLSAALKKAQPGYSDLGRSAPSDLRSLIDTYYQVLR